MEQTYSSGASLAPTASLSLPTSNVLVAGVSTNATSSIAPPLNLVHTSSGLTTTPFVVRNTFVEVQDPDAPPLKRSERRTKTMPANSVSPSCVVDEPSEETYSGAISMPVGEMSKYRMSAPATVGQPSMAPCSVASPFQELEPAIIKPSAPQVYPTMSVGPQQMFQIMQPVMMQPVPMPKVAQPAGPPGVFLPVAANANGTISTQPMAAKVLSTSSASPSVDGRSLLGNVWSLSQDAQGCRQVQAAFDSSSEDVCLALAHELHGHVNEALHSPHANFVVRKCVERVPPQHCQFVIDELLSVGPTAIAEAARHRYGCRIIEALFSTCPSSQLQPIASPLLADIPGLCGHMYGNFVMQKMLEHSTDEHKRLILEELHSGLGTLGPSFYASAVYGTAFKTVALEDRVLLARSLAQNPNVLVSMSRFKHGPEVVELCLGHIDDTTSQAIRAQLTTAAAQRQQAAAATAAQPKMARVLSDKKQRRSSNPPFITRVKSF